VLVVALGLTSGAVFEFGLRRQVCVDDVQQLAWRPVVCLAVVNSTLAGALSCVNFAIEPSAATARGVALTILAIAGGTPAMAALLGIRSAVLITGGLEPRQDARRLQGYLDLRGMAVGLLRALGSLVALTTFALGASRRAMPAGTPGLVPPEIVIAFGVIGATLVGLIYAVPSQALRNEARALVRELTPLAGKDAAALRRELGERELGTPAGPHRQPAQ